MLNFCDFIQVNVFTTNHHLKCGCGNVILFCTVVVLLQGDDVN